MPCRGLRLKLSGGYAAKYDTIQIRIARGGIGTTIIAPRECPIRTHEPMAGSAPMTPLVASRLKKDKL